MFKKVLFFVSFLLVLFAIGFVGNVTKLSFENNFLPIKKAEEVKIFFVGDVMLSRQIGKIIDSKDDTKFPFELIAPYLNTADLVVANLENPVSLRGKNVGSIYSFRANPKVLEGLKFANINFVSLANNHIWDYGREAFFDTMSYLASSSIGFAGIGADFAEASRPYLWQKNGIKFAFVSFTSLAPNFLLAKDSQPSVLSAEAENVTKVIKEIKQSLPEYFIVAIFHWGEEYKTIHNLSQENLAKVAVLSGAKLVIGHHPHVIQDVGEYDGVPIVYSLGNFVFDQNFSEETSKGMVFEVVFGKNGIIKTSTTTVHFNKNFQSYLLSE